MCRQSTAPAPAPAADGLTADERALRLRADLPVAGGGAIVMLGAPGLAQAVDGAGWIDPEAQAAALSALRARGAAQLVALCAADELPPGAGPLLATACAGAGLRLRRAPIPDFQPPGPGFLRRWRRIGPDLHAALDRAEAVALSCLFGAGRSGTVATLLLIERGAAPGAALAAVRRAWPRAVESPAQRDWLASRRPGRDTAGPPRHADFKKTQHLRHRSIIQGA